MIELVVIAALATASPADHVRNYVGNVLSGDLEAAAAGWRDEDLTSSQRLAIQYSDQPLKVDGDSPLWRALDALRAGTATWSVEDVPGDNNADLVLRTDDQEIRHRYALVATAAGWRLASPVTLAMARLPAHPGAYVCLHGDATTLALLDSCVVAMAARLAIPPDRLAAVASAKLGYLVLPAAEVEQLAGAPTVGIANLQHDVVVTSHPCHAHELAHLVVNAWLGELPLFTLPLLQEGTATHLGGRWGRHPRVLDRVGRTTLADGFVSLDDLLARDDFQAQSADVTYAAAAAFAGFLLDRFGAAGLRAAYLAGSGTAAEVASWRRDDVKYRLAAALGTTWPAVAADFLAYVETTAPSAVEPGLGGSPSPFTSLSESDSFRLEMRRDRDAVAFRLHVAHGEPRGAILFGAGAADLAANDLFTEHFPDRPYHGERCGVLFTPDEVKVYDYHLQMLVGLHAEGFWPSTTYADDDGRALTYTVDRALLGNVDDWAVVLP